MSARLSRRFGVASYYPPLLELPATEKLTLCRRTEERHTEFEDLLERDQRLILEAEANMRQHWGAAASSKPKELDQVPRKQPRRAGRAGTAAARRRSAPPAEETRSAVAAERRG